MANYKKKPNAKRHPVTVRLTDDDLCRLHSYAEGSVTQQELLYWFVKSGLETLSRWSLTMVEKKIHPNSINQDIKPKKLTKDALAQDLSAGKTLSEIAEEYEVSVNSIYRMINEIERSKSIYKRAIE